LPSDWLVEKDVNTEERSKLMSYEPKIIAFCCNWCSYAAADLAGTARMQYPHNVRIIRLMCSGMVHPEFIVNALSQGADGVMVLG
jgi:F420-non-reducing hydrogenase iron-sulfur subunit